MRSTKVIGRIGMLLWTKRDCLNGRIKSAGGFVWRYASLSERLTAIHSTTKQLQAASSKAAYGRIDLSAK